MSIEFGTKEMEDYIVGRLQDHAISTTEDLAAECIIGKLSSTGNHSASVSAFDVTTMISVKDEEVDIMIQNLAGKYNINLECIDLGESMGKIRDTLGTVKDIGERTYKLYQVCKDYFTGNKTAENASKCVREAFSFASTLASPEFGDKACVLAQMYQAIMTEYDFLFSMAGDSAKGLYAVNTTEIIDARNRFMSMYEKLSGNGSADSIVGGAGNYLKGKNDNNLAENNGICWKADAVFPKGDRQTAPLQAG